MTRYLLDTNIVSYFIRGVNATLIARVAQALEAQTATISVITRAELRFGQAGLAPSDKRHRAVELMLTQLTVLPWTVAAADTFGPLKMSLQRQGTPIGDMDTLIAAHALAEQCTLVTHNVRHFKHIPQLKVQDWME